MSRNSIKHSQEKKHTSGKTVAEKKKRYLNRELNWLEFNERVLEEAYDPSVPLLERLKFLAISSSNLNEFFQVRVGGIELLINEGFNRPEPSGLTPLEQLAAIRNRVLKMLDSQYRLYTEILEPELRRAGIERVLPSELEGELQDFAERHFESEVYPLLTPMAVTPFSPAKDLKKNKKKIRDRKKSGCGCSEYPVAEIEIERPFPLLRNLAINIAVRLAPENPRHKRFRYAIVPVPPVLKRFIKLPEPEISGKFRYLLVEDQIIHFISRLFEGETILECVPFTVTRNADMTLREEFTSDLLAEMEEILLQRRTSNCVRLEVGKNVSREMLNFLMDSLEIDENRVYFVGTPVCLSDFRTLSSLEGYRNLKYEPWPPLIPPVIDSRVSMFENIAKRDILLIHPYNSFEPVVRLIEEAADDPDVISIKQILYRVSDKSPIVRALHRAAEKGKHVTAIVELRARFDEERNINWALELEKAGVQVVYGVKRFKTHAKVLLILRREPRGIVRYMHFGTGNYNEVTAKIYSDVSLLTCNDELGLDTCAFLNSVTGYSQPQNYRLISAAPFSIRDRLTQLIRDEAERKKHGQKALIMAKVNSLSDTLIIDELYAASQAGVEIKLNVRGICCLRPGVKKLSENIRVVSIVDRYLEHARILYFHHGGEQLVFISSADWMRRNIDRRVELMIPVLDPSLKKKLIKTLEIYFADNVKARELKADGSYIRAAKSGSRKVRAQERLYQEELESLKKAGVKRTILEPYRPV